MLSKSHCKNDGTRMFSAEEFENQIPASKILCEVKYASFLNATDIRTSNNAFEI